MKKKFTLILSDKLKKKRLYGKLITPRPTELTINSKCRSIIFPNYSRKQIIKSYEFCEKTFNKSLKLLSVELNKIHGTNYSIKSWDIIIGRWLRNIIHIFYNCYIQIKYIKKNFEIEKVYLTDYRKYNFYLQDTFNFDYAKNDSSWLFSLYSKIFDL